jgi:hypothetical protein
LLKAGLARTAAPDRRDRIELAGIDFHWPNASMTHGLDHTLGYNPLRLGDYSRATGAGDHIALPDQRRFSALMPGYRSMLANMLGLRFIASRVPLEQVDRSLSEASLAAGPLRQIARTADAYIYENSAALPRVMVAAEARTVDTGVLLATGSWPEGFDPARTVLLADPVAPATCEAPKEAVAGPATASIRRYGNTEVVVEVQSPTCAYLVLNDAWQRWWSAEVDGEAEPVLRANVLFRAVAIPAGRSTVVFRFEPFAGLASDMAARMPPSLLRGLGRLVAGIDSVIGR